MLNRSAILAKTCLVVVASFIVSSCQQQPPPRPLAPGVLIAKPSPLYFGQVRVGGSKQLDLVFANERGRGQIDFALRPISGPGRAVFTASPTATVPPARPTTLKIRDPGTTPAAPTATQTIKITCNPTAQQLYTALYAPLVVPPGTISRSSLYPPLLICRGVTTANPGQLTHFVPSGRGDENILNFQSEFLGRSKTLPMRLVFRGGGAGVPLTLRWLRRERDSQGRLDFSYPRGTPLTVVPSPPPPASQNVLAFNVKFTPRSAGLRWAVFELIGRSPAGTVHRVTVLLVGIGKQP